MTDDLGSKGAEVDSATTESSARQAVFDRRYKLLELKERRADRELKRHEIEVNRGRGFTFTSAQATIAAAALALLSAVLGGLIQGAITRDVEKGKNQALLEIEKLKDEATIQLEQQKQDAAERLDRAKFETTLILKATEAANREDQIRNLKFFLNAGFIRDPDNKIAKMDDFGIPIFGAANGAWWSQLLRSGLALVGFDLHRRSVLLQWHSYCPKNGYVGRSMCCAWTTSRL